MCAPDPGGQSCTPGFGNFDCSGFDACHIAGNGGRCEASSGNPVLGSTCTSNYECNDSEQCYQGKCWWVCALADPFPCSSCTNIGLAKYGLCHM